MPARAGHAPNIMPAMRRRSTLAILAAAAGLVACLPGCRSGPGSRTGPLFPAPMGTQWGYIDGAGRQAIAPAYENAGGFSSGRAPVALHDRWGYIDVNGAVLIPAIYRSAQEFRGDLAIVDSGLVDHPFGLIDPKGGWVVSPSFRSLAPGDEAGELYLGQHEAGEASAFYDRRGKLVCGPFEMAFPFSEGRARVKNESGQGWVDVSCHFTSFPDAWPESTRFAGGMIAARQGGKVGYLEPGGTFVIPPQYDGGGDFHEGLAPVEKAGRWFFIDPGGAVSATLPDSVRHAEALSQGRSLVTADVVGAGRKLGYVDRSGQWAGEPRWDEAEPYRDGLARVGEWRGDVVAYIGLSGEIVWKGALPRGIP